MKRQKKCDFHRQKNVISTDKKSWCCTIIKTLLTDKMRFPHNRMPDSPQNKMLFPQNKMRFPLNKMRFSQKKIWFPQNKMWLPYYRNFLLLKWGIGSIENETNNIKDLFIQEVLCIFQQRGHQIASDEWIESFRLNMETFEHYKNFNLNKYLYENSRIDQCLICRPKELNVLIQMFNSLSIDEFQNKFKTSIFGLIFLFKQIFIALLYSSFINDYNYLSRLEKGFIL